MKKKNAPIQSDFLRYCVILIIAILITLTVHVGFSAFYPAPDFPQTDCYLLHDRFGEEPSQEYTTCMEQERQYYQAYSDHQATRQQWAFGILTVLFLIIMLVGIYMPFVSQATREQANTQLLANALVLAGLIGIFTTTMRTWDALNTQFQFLTLLIETIIVIFLVIKKLK